MVGEWFCGWEAICYLWFDEDLMQIWRGFDFTHIEGHFTHETESPWPLHFEHSHWWKRWSWSKFAFTLRLRDQRSTWMQDGCKVYMGFYMASHGLCFMVTWIVFKNYLLEVGPTQNRDTMALRTLTTTDLFYFILCEDPHEWISQRLGLQIVVSQNYITVVHL